MYFIFKKDTKLNSIFLLNRSSPSNFIVYFLIVSTYRNKYTRTQISDRLVERLTLLESSAGRQDEEEGGNEEEEEELGSVSSTGAAAGGSSSRSSSIAGGSDG